jgi:hypothetical protein
MTTRKALWEQVLDGTMPASKPARRDYSVSYMVRYIDPDDNELVTDSYATESGRDGWAADLHSRGVEVEVWTHKW